MTQDEEVSSRPRRVPPMLSDDDAAVLDIERTTWRRAGAKEAVIRARLGLSAHRYYQRLNQLIDDPAALLYDPVTVNRLRRVRDERRQRRA